ncbi:MAG TPA: type II secretion system F family protein, partial [Campylobacterales bacterium]|nr:type II secretion system F family protein [Campylobacterales bacterium]
KLEAIKTIKESGGQNITKIQEGAAPLFGSFSPDAIKAVFGRKKVNMEAFIAAVRQMAVMSNAGLSFTNTLEEAVASTQNARLKEILTQNLSDINAGLSLSQSMQQFEKEVGRLTVTMIELGERTGAMSESLETLAGILEEIKSNKEKIKKALRYPMSVVTAMVIAFTILIIVVIPKFKSVFDRFKADLPLPTKILLNMEWFLSHYGVLFFALIAVAFVLLKYIYNTNGDIRLKADRAALNAPIVGSMLSLGLIGRFTIVFKELAKAGLPITEALNIAAKGVENSYIRAKLASVNISIQRGLSLSSSLKEAKIYENMIIQMIKAGEQSGSLITMLDKTADYYRQKFQNKMDGLTAAIEPLLIGAIAGFVLLLALGIFMPMWDMAEVVKR